MSNTSKKGRMPISDKQTAKRISYGEVFEDNSAIPADIVKDIADQGLECRWLDAKSLHENQGYHKRGWEVYRRPKYDKMGNVSKVWGNDPDGLVRRGDRILGVKTQEKAELHRNYLTQQADAQNLKNLQKRQVEELRQLGRNEKIDIKIDSDFD